MEMDDETEARIVEKVEYIGEAVTVLSNKQNLEKTAYLEDREQRAIVERDVLSTETAEAMQEAAQFRNVLAHTYGHDIDDERVYQHLQDDLHWFPTFLREVRETLDDQ
jgi:uncharacterized protein with HEPN domain